MKPSVQSGATLLSNGTLAQPVVFTSIHDDTHGGDTDQDGGLTPPQLGDWDQVLNQGVDAARARLAENRDLVPGQFLA